MYFCHAHVVIWIFDNGINISHVLHRKYSRIQQNCEWINDIAWYSNSFSDITCFVVTKRVLAQDWLEHYTRRWPLHLPRLLYVWQRELLLEGLCMIFSLNIRYSTAYRNVDFSIKCYYISNQYKNIRIL